MSCRHCLRRDAGVDLCDFSRGRISYASVLGGHTPHSLSASVASLEERHRLGITSWCSRCKCFGICVHPLAPDSPPVHVSEHVVHLLHMRELYDIAVD